VLSKPEVDAAMKSMGKTLSEQELEDVFNIADADGSGGVSFEEFVLVSQLPEETMVDISRAAMAEFFGVALFQFFGGMPNAGALGNGVALIVLIYGTASVSGGHLNPAVTFGLAVTQQITPIKMVLYWIAQLAGGICGAAWVYALNNGSDQNIFTKCSDQMYSIGDNNNIAIVGCNSCTIPTFDSPGSSRFLVPGKVFGVEFLATFLLVFTVFATAVDPRGAAGNAAPFAIGSSLWAAASGIAGITGAALNPARTLCPAIVFQCWSAISQTEATSLFASNGSSDGTDTRQWAYVFAQLTAGACAGGLYMAVFLTRPDDGNPGPQSVFKFVARDGVKTRVALKAHGGGMVAGGSATKTDAMEVTMGDDAVTLHTESAIQV